ncbi:MAG: co-chaperone GroES [Actinobacteria bacterium]|jgi:chaperonin GroES|nr:co-chaperone GroES [Actinomycetota bacterium]MCL6095526.1 co-chaperone GroES [Actinomycetota bacterium]
MAEEVQPLGSRVLVKVLPEESTTPSGLVIPDTAKDKPQRGEVVAIGDDTEEIKVSIGDKVLYPKYSGTELRLSGEDYLILEGSDLLAVLRSV